MDRIILSILLVFLYATGSHASVYDILEEGRRLSSMGAYKKALIQYDSIISNSGTRKSLLFETYDARARCHKLLGNYALSLSDYDNALNIPASKLNLAIVSLNKSDLLLQTGRYVLAEELLKQIDDHTPQIRYRRISNMASVFVRTGRYDEAEVLYQSLLTENYEETERGRILQNMGFLYMIQGRWKDASINLSEAYPLFKDNTPDKYIALSNLAFAQAFCHDNNALNNITAAVDNLTSMLGDKHPDVTTAIRKRAEIYFFLSEKVLAANDFSRYYRNTSEGIISTFEGMTTQGKIDFWKKEKPLLSLAFGLENDNPGLLFDIALFRRGMAMATNDTSYSKIMSLHGSDIMKRLGLNDVAVDFIVYPKRDDKGMLSNWIGAIVAKRNGLKFVSLGKEKDFDNHKICGINLKSAISSGNSSHIDAIYSDTTLTNKIWNPILDGIGKVKNIYFVPDGIFNLLAVEYLPGIPKDIQIHRLTNLANLSSRVISDDDDSILLIGGLDYNALSLASYNCGSIDHAASDFLKENIENVCFRSLPGMKEEVERIKSILPHSIISTDMPEETFKSRVPKLKKIHISSHGYTIHTDEPAERFFLTDSITADNSLLASGLVLSGANIACNYPDREDGLLSAREICDLDMSGIEFISLSACQTADGKINDEGPAGIVRGLKKAGAGSIIATLWEVNDTAALIFMTKFYELRHAGVERASAFRQAREYLKGYVVEEPEIIAEFDPAIQSTRIMETGVMIPTYPYSSPSMWAPFILIDNYLKN